jgi:hypothetical protein
MGSCVSGSISLLHYGRRFFPSTNPPARTLARIMITQNTINSRPFLLYTDSELSLALKTGSSKLVILFPIYYFFHFCDIFNWQCGHIFLALCNLCRMQGEFLILPISEIKLKLTNICWTLMTGILSMRIQILVSHGPCFWGSHTVLEFDFRVFYRVS